MLQPCRPYTYPVLNASDHWPKAGKGTVCSGLTGSGRSLTLPHAPYHTLEVSGELPCVLLYTVHAINATKITCSKSRPWVANVTVCSGMTGRGAHQGLTSCVTPGYAPCSLHAQARPNAPKR